MASNTSASPDIVHSPSMVEIFQGITPPVRPDDVGKLAVGPRKAELLHSPRGSTSIPVKRS